MNPSRCLAPEPARTVANLDAIRILYCGNLADDDFMWIVEAPYTELPTLIETPQQWVFSLGLHESWIDFSTGERVPPPVLTNHFEMGMRKVHRDTITPGCVIVQGISETGIISVRGADTLAIPAIRAIEKYESRFGHLLAEQEGKERPNLSAYWEHVRFNQAEEPKELAVNVDLGSHYFYAHRCIWDPSSDPSYDRSDVIAANIMAMMADPSGYVMMLNGLPQITTYLSNGNATYGPPIQFTTTSFIVPDYASSSFSQEEACEILEGPYSSSNAGGPGILTHAVVKDYRPSPPGPPIPPRKF